MIGEINLPKNTSVVSDKNAAAQKKTINSNTPQAVNPKTSVDSKPVQAFGTKTPAPLVFPRSAVVLPGDRFSASIVSLLRFFSLPLKPSVLAAVKNQVLSALRQEAANNTAGTTSSETVKGREALSLAAAAAESKGVELSPKGLEAYAEAIDPEKNHRRRRKSKEQSKQEEKKHTDIITAEELKKMAETDNNYLMDVLNSLPGKNGERWIVIPLHFTQDDCEFRVSMRIKLENGRNNGCMALDIIKIKNDKNRNRWLFIIESANDIPVKAIIYLDPSMIDMEKNIIGFFGIPAERIFVNYFTQTDSSFPYETSDSEQPLAVSEVI